MATKNGGEPTRTDPAARARALAMRLFVNSLGAAELMVMYVGDRLGLYDALAAGPATFAELAARADIAPRYAQEWLEQQAAAGIVDVDDPDADPAARRFVLPAGHRQALTDQTSLFSVLPLAVLPVGGIAPMLPRIADAFRTGAGLAYADYGDVFRAAQTGMNRPVFEHQLATWIRVALPDIHARLYAPAAAIADVGCGVGHSAIALAAAYPTARVDGFELTDETVRTARHNAEQAGQTDGRLAFHVGEVPARRYHLVCVFDALHDMPDPVRVLTACRTALADGGCVLLMEPRVGERFTAPAEDVERFLYAVSVLHCLPVGLAEPDSVATGTVMRPDTLRGYAAKAGFRATTVLPVEHRFHRLYRLDV